MIQLYLQCRGVSAGVASTTCFGRSSMRRIAVVSMMRPSGHPKATAHGSASASAGAGPQAPPAGALTVVFPARRTPRSIAAPRAAGTLPLALLPTASAGAAAWHKRRHAQLCVNGYSSGRMCSAPAQARPSAAEQGSSRALARS
eukprot:scaffold108162_cov28-Tisochrysis_lutea.AAC.2